jgi:hypothetical protein
LESASDLTPEKPPYRFEGECKILALLWKNSISKADAWVEDLHLLKRCRTKVLLSGV